MEKNKVSEKKQLAHASERERNQRLGLPKGVNWEGERTIIDFGLNPRLGKLPDMFRLISVAHMVGYYGEFSKPNNSVRILDAGAGFAELYLLIQTAMKAAGTRASYIGVDVDFRKRNSALELFGEKLDYRLLDFTKDWNAVLPESDFDVITSSEVLEHLEKPDGIEYLKKIFGKLRPGGHLILTTPSEFRRSTNPWHLHEWAVKELHDQLDELGFELVDSFYMRPFIKEIEKNVNLEGRQRRMPSEAIRAVLVGPEHGSIQALVARKPEDPKAVESAPTEAPEASEAPETALPERGAEASKPPVRKLAIKRRSSNVNV